MPWDEGRDEERARLRPTTRQNVVVVAAVVLERAMVKHQEQNSRMPQVDWDVEGCCDDSYHRPRDDHDNDASWMHNRRD